REAQLESSAEADPEKGAPRERKSALRLAGIEPAVRIERQDRRVRFLVPIVAGLRRGVPPHRSRVLPAEDAGPVEKTLRAEVAAVAEGEEALVVLERERGEGRTEPELSQRTRSERQLRSAASRREDGEPGRRRTDVGDEMAALERRMGLRSQRPLRAGAAHRSGSETGSRRGRYGSRIELDLGDAQREPAGQRDGHLDVRGAAIFAERAQARLTLALPESDVAADGGAMAALDTLHVAGDLRVQDLGIGPRGEPRRSFRVHPAADSFLRNLRGPE